MFDEYSPDILEFENNKMTNDDAYDQNGEKPINDEIIINKIISKLNTVKSISMAKLRISLFCKKYRPTIDKWNNIIDEIKRRKLIKTVKKLKGEIISRNNLNIKKNEE